MRSIERMQAALRRAQMAFGVSPEATDDDGQLRFVALCRGGRFSELNHALQPHQVVCALSEKVAIDLALGDVVDGLIIDSALPGLDALQFIEKIRAHPDLADMPLMVFAPAFEHEALLAVGSDKMVRNDTISDDAGHFGRIYRDIRALRQQLRRAKAQAAVHIVASEEILHRHIALALADDGSTFVVACLDCLAVEDTALAPGDTAIRRAIYQMLVSLTRAEDVVLDGGSAGVMLILPDVSVDTGLLIINRLDRIARNSAFLDQKGAVVSGISFVHRLVAADGFNSAPAIWDSLRQPA